MSEASDAIHAVARPLLDHPCDLVDIERRKIEVDGHTLLAIDIWFTPVLQDGPTYYLGLLADPEAANKVHLLSPEQYAAFTQPAVEATNQETTNDG